jgi:predicted DNA-binding antitoxin AbrB/MazE fold protein
MSITIDLIYDGMTFRPEGPVDLEPNTRVRVTIESTEAVVPKKRSFLQTARALKLDGPPDWSARLEEYLYRERRIDGRKEDADSDI